MRASLGILILCALTLTGCAVTGEPVEVQYRPGNDVTTYETERIDTGLRFSESGLGTGQRVDMLVRGRCAGQDCAPQQLRLYFYTGRGTSQQIYLSDRTVRFEVGTENFTWRPQRPREIEETSPILGEIVHIDLDLETLRKIARAGTVRGALGSNTFELSYERRAPLRLLVERLAEAGTGVLNDSS